VDYVDRSMVIHPDEAKAKVVERPTSWGSTRTLAVPCAQFNVVLSDVNCCIFFWSCSMGANLRSLVQTSSRIYLLRVVWCMAPATCVAGQHEEFHSSEINFVKSSTPRLGKTKMLVFVKDRSSSWMVDFESSIEIHFPGARYLTIARTAAEPFQE
jgi:hypothetical protein